MSSDTPALKGASSFTELKLAVGDTLHIELLQTNTRCASRLIGYMDGSSVIISTPVINGKLPLLREGQPIKVRVMSRSYVSGFTTFIKRVCPQPFPYLHLNYPLDIESIEVRKAPRANVRLLISVEEPDNPVDETDEDWPKAAAITDLSTSGAKVASSAVLGEKGTQLKMLVRLKIADMEQSANITGIIRSVKRIAANPPSIQKTTYSYGMEFVDLENETLLALNAYVYQQLLD